VTLPVLSRDPRRVERQQRLVDQLGGQDGPETAAALDVRASNGLDERTRSGCFGS
jgi:hypothetical protein